jgi:hypothetical protein
MRAREILCAAALVLAVGGGAVGCSSGAGSSPAASGERFPDVTKVEVEVGDGSYTFNVTMTSPYDTAKRYADGIRVRSVDGTTVYGQTTLGHDHASEQPFTRSVSSVEIPDGVDEVVVEGHDQVSGWGGGTQTIHVP